MQASKEKVLIVTNLSVIDILIIEILITLNIIASFFQFLF